MSLGGYILLGIAVWLLFACFGVLIEIKNLLKDHIFRNFKIECEDPSDHLKFKIGDK